MRRFSWLFVASTAALLVLLSSTGISWSQERHNAAFLNSFYEVYFKSRMDFGWGSQDPEAYFRIEQALINGSKGIIGVRSPLGLVSTIADRFAGYVLAIPDSPGNLKYALGALAAVSETRGLLEDLGLAQIGGSENWLYEANTYLGLLLSAREATDALEVVKNIGSFKDLYAAAKGGTAAADAAKLSNLKMLGIAVADFFLDKTIAAQVRGTLQMDRLKLLLLSIRSTQAHELERLYRKAKYKTLDWFEAFRLMQLEGQYFARRAECYGLDAMFWEEQLSPTVGRLPFTKKTLLDLMPGYDNPELERENLESARSMYQNSIWHRDMCEEFYEKTLAEFETRSETLDRKPDEAPALFFIENERLSSAASPATVALDPPLDSSQVLELLVDARNNRSRGCTISEIIALLYPDVVYPREIYPPFEQLLERYSQGVYFVTGASQELIKQNLSAPVFGYSGVEGKYVYVHLWRDVPVDASESDSDYYDNYGSSFVYIVALAAARANLDADPESEVVLVVYQDEEELATFGFALDRHSVIVADIVGTGANGEPVFKKYKGAFYADRVNSLEILDVNNDGRPEIVVHEAINNEAMTHRFAFNGSRVLYLEE